MARGEARDPELVAGERGLLEAAEDRRVEAAGDGEEAGR